MRSLYLNAITNLTAILSAVDLDPKVDISTELCFLLSHITGAWLQKINMPVYDDLVTFFMHYLHLQNSAWTSV